MRKIVPFAAGAVVAAVASSAAYAFVPLASAAQTTPAPATLAIRAGTTVTFRKSDAVAHTVAAAGTSFDSGNVDAGASWPHVFAVPGTYAYLCADHPFMRGTIVVR